MKALSRLDVQRLRQDFPMLSKTMHGKPLIYLDSAATAQKPLAVIDAITNFYRDHYGTVHRAIYELATYSTEEYQNTRQKLRPFSMHPKSRKYYLPEERPNPSILLLTLFARHLLTQEMKSS